MLDDCVIQSAELFVLNFKIIGGVIQKEYTVK